MAIDLEVGEALLEEVIPESLAYFLDLKDEEDDDENDGEDEEFDEDEDDDDDWVLLLIFISVLSIRLFIFE